MCGIAGFVGVGDRSDLEAMTRALTHRGPDAEGFHIDRDRGLHLGHRRLAIRDLAGGGQPMWSRDATLCVVFNGEIFNFEDLRAELEGGGHRFETDHSDTEVLIHGYRAWGEGLAERLNGQFAFAIFDLERERLYLARDRFGEKPLYYSARSELFAFASELSALTCHRAVGTEISATALQKLFAYGYLPAPHALYSETYKLPAGHFMTVDLRTRHHCTMCYWRFDLEPDEDLAARGEEVLAEELRELLTRAVARRLVSDVPIGIFLSGGLDSSGILATAATHVPADSLRSFTIGFEEASYDESGFAAQVAEHVGTQHRSRVLSLGHARDLIPSVLDGLDEPLGDASIVPTHLLSAFTREHVTVALSGDGGDELFAGYDPFAALGPAALYSRTVPRPLHEIFRWLAGQLPRSGRNMSLDFKLRRTLAGLSYPESAWAPAWMAPIDSKEATELFDQPMPMEEVYSEAMDLWETGPARGRIDRLLQFFTQIYLQDDILTKSDRASMMSSLESRAVFLDNDLVSFCQRLPNRFKFRNGQRKYLLKKALEPLLPTEIVHRRKKGFGIPLADWMCEVPQEIPMFPIPGTDTGWARHAWEAHRTGRADYRLFMWTWWSLQRAAHRSPAMAATVPA
ncbi:asparagine synthase (glutamine-hydrolyzing) [Marivibrio halodurans]|uniref:asparagine synthase (glutamine-hydrolyzing) n=1 Tax=Marivibrio halodurans TaxID=2039722 RepID=A0A8J7RYW7_9PROT|nr:asparagine synthase (glutamine-hydrolyzing) [Marivibrio halodurans]MBP5855628.1 asparagine synthase (glutamine-hydrolyzing) [Marivibrio halodurans]